MISLKQLRLKNFFSYVDTTVNLSDYEGLVLIEGHNTDGHYSSNGSGKSTILEGIIYALTGNTLRGVAVNDIINRNYKKDAQVSLEFLQENDRYSVRRYRKDKQYGDSLILQKNQEDISKRVTKETQSSLDDILGISYKILTSTMLLGEGLSSRFTQLSDPEKKSLIESTLNLNYDLSKIRDKANEELKRLSREIARLEGEISVLCSYEEQDINQVEDSIKDNEECIRIYQSTSEHLKETYENLAKEIESVNPKLQVITTSINQYGSNNQKYQELLQLNSHYQEEMDRVANGETPVCSMCHQLLQSVNSKQAVISSYQEKIDDNLRSMSAIEEILKKLPDIQIMKMKYNSLSSEYSEKSMKYRESMQEYNDYQVKIVGAQKDIESLKSIISNAANNHEQLEEKKLEKDSLTKDKSKYEYFYQLFSPTGIIVSILSEAIDYINSRLSVYSGVLLEKDYKLNFVKNKLSLVDSQGSSYQSLSNGEKRRLDISIQFALHDYVSTYCGMKMDCCFIDEILDTLDDIGVENIFDVLRLKLEYCQLKSIFVITHNNELKSRFDQSISVYKDEKGNSYIS